MRVLCLAVYLVLTILPEAAFGSATRTVDLLASSKEEQGSIIVSRDARESQQLLQSIGLGAQGVYRATIITGKMAIAMQNYVGKENGQVQVVGSYHQQHRYFVMVNHAAHSFDRVLEYIYGGRIYFHRGLVVLKGGLSDLITCLDGLLQRTVDLGVTLVDFAATLLCTGVDVTLSLADVLVSLAGHVVVKSINGAVMIVEFGVGLIGHVVHCLADGTIVLLDGAVQSVFWVRDGIVRPFFGALRDLFGCLLGCQRYSVKTW